MHYLTIIHYGRDTEIALDDNYEVVEATQEINGKIQYRTISDELITTLRDTTEYLDLVAGYDPNAEHSTCY